MVIINFKANLMADMIYGKKDFVYGRKIEWAAGLQFVRPQQVISKFDTC